MKKYCLIFLFAIISLVSCRKEPVLPSQPENPQPEQPKPEDPQPENPQPDGERDVTIEATTDAWWKGGDEIALVFYHSENAPYINKEFVNVEAAVSEEVAVFKGQIPNSVTTEYGYDNLGFAVCPNNVITEDGHFVYNIPEEQVADSDGSLAPGLCLSSAALALDEMGGGQSAKCDFRGALSVIKLDLSTDIESVTISGTSPLTGTAPLQVYYNAGNKEDADNGRLLVVEGTWEDASTSVTLKPAEGAIFNTGTYDILVWPGKHEKIDVTLNFKNLGQYTSSVSYDGHVAFEPARYYKLDIVNAEHLLVEDITGRLDDINSNLPDLGEVEDNIEALLAQIQSVTLMTEYLDNAVYAPYGVFYNGMQKLDISVDYIVKPESAAQALVEAFKKDPSVAKAVLGYRKSSGWEDAGELAITDLSLSDAPFGKYMTATVSSDRISKEFYDGKYGASIALQIASEKTEILSDFANLVPKSGCAFDGSFMNDIPVIPGARVVIPFNFAVSDSGASYTLTVESVENADVATVNYNKDFRTGNLSVWISDRKPVDSQSVTLAIKVGSGTDAEVASHTFTFVDSGSRIDFVDPGLVDYIGGEITLNLTTHNIKNYMLSCSGAGVSQSGNIFTFSANTGAERTVNVECQATIPAVSLNYYKSITLTQKAVGTSLSKQYYADGQKVVLNQADAPGCSNYFNIVILGDGYQKKDLSVGGKFERSAKSAMDIFFSIEPYKTFKDRFNVYMVTYESKDEGTDIRSSGVTKDTYFNSYCQGGGNTAAFVDGTDKVVNVVKTAAGAGDDHYYRSIAILLINTDEQSGSAGYPFRDYKSGFANGYASFAIAALAANSTGTNGLVKHEAGGHAFGRLADEYYTNGKTANSSNQSDLNNWHSKGWYWNVNPDKTSDYYMFTNSAYSAAEVGYIEGAWGYQYGMYRSTQGGMMQGSTGVFNAVSRHAIYHRIITESEGVGAYSWVRFLEYDQKNR